MPLVLAGATSGQATVQATDAQTVTLTLPATSGTLVTTGGAQTIEFADGSASAPSITNSGDTNTGIFFPAADTIAFTEGGAEAMRITSTGQVGVGTTTPGDSFVVSDGSGGAGWEVGNGGGNATVQAYNRTTSLYTNYTDASLARIFQTGTSPTERMRIDSSGKLLVGTTSFQNNNDSGVISWSSATGSGGEGAFEFINTSSSANSDPNPALVIYKGSTTYTSSQRFIQFNAAAQAMGGIVGNGATNVQFISLSDVREKENIEPITGSLNKVVALNPVEFDWKQTGEHITAGFIAQEVESLFPEYVVDNVANAGEEERKGLTGGMSAGFIAHLVKAIQEQQTIITDLKARIETLENT